MKTYDFDQGSDEWRQIRLGKVTGSRLSDIYTKSKSGGKGTEGDSLIYTLIAEEVSQDISDTYQSFAMKKGTELEPFARIAYVEKYNIEVKQVGFCQHDKYDWLGFSPDGFVMDNDRHAKCLEIKCPNTNTHVRYLTENVVPKDYWHQVLSSFFINPDQESCDFVSFCPLFTAKPLFIKTVYRDEWLEKELKETEIALLKFREKWQAIYENIIL